MKVEVAVLGSPSIIVRTVSVDDEVLLYVHRNRRLIKLLGTGAQDGHLDFHTAPEFSSLWT